MVSCTRCFLLFFSAIPMTVCSPGPWLRTSNSLFMESRDLQVTQEFLAPSEIVSNGTELVPHIVRLFSSYVSVSESLFDQYGTSRRGFSVHSSPGSIFESAGIIILTVDELLTDPENNYAMLVLLAQDSDADLHACVAHVTGTQINLGPSSQVSCEHTAGWMHELYCSVAGRGSALSSRTRRVGIDYGGSVDIGPLRHCLCHRLQVSCPR